MSASRTRARSAARRSAATSRRRCATRSVTSPRKAPWSSRRRLRSRVRLSASSTKPTTVSSESRGTTTTLVPSPLPYQDARCVAERRGSSGPVNETRRWVAKACIAGGTSPILQRVPGGRADRTATRVRREDLGIVVVGGAYPAARGVRSAAELGRGEVQCPSRAEVAAVTSWRRACVPLVCGPYSRSSASEVTGSTSRAVRSAGAASHCRVVSTTRKYVSATIIVLLGLALGVAWRPGKGAGDVVEHRPRRSTRHRGRPESLRRLPGTSLHRAGCGPAASCP